MEYEMIDRPRKAEAEEADDGRGRWLLRRYRQAAERPSAGPDDDSGDCDAVDGDRALHIPEEEYDHQAG